MIEDTDLNKVSGGVDPVIPELTNSSDLIIDAIKSLNNKFFGTIGELFQLIKTSSDTNTCPICNQQIIPNAEKCEPMDFINHVKANHINE
ncbi:MAG: hypothetical protein K6A70_09090 [Erysipelotrichaceae bacterium]|nr:hypothetical protein [Erysipelotrichaceae bacterium]